MSSACAADTEALQYAIGAQANAAQYLPIALILLFALEAAGVDAWLIHAFGILLIAGRLIHARGLPAKDFRLRVLGMQLTVTAIIGLAVANLAWLVYSYVVI